MFSLSGVLFCFVFFNLKALLDEQRHHVCEGPRSLGYALQICRADEHPNAFQVTVIVREKAAFSVASNFIQSLFFFLLQGKNVTLQTGRAKPWAGKSISGIALFFPVALWWQEIGCFSLPNEIHDRHSCEASALM